jgi:hypothetical protein
MRKHSPFPRYTRLSVRTRKAVYGTLQHFWRAFPPARRFYRSILDRLEMPVVEVPIRRLPGPFHGYTIAFLSDLHGGSFCSAPLLRGVARRVASVRPDLVALGGDFIQYADADIEDLGPAVGELRARDGVVAVPGNHEYYARDPDAVLARLGSFGAKVLRNEAIAIRREGATLWIVGADDGEAGRFDLDAALRDVENGDPRILLSHQPDALPLAARRGIDLVISGHTHGGQVRLPFVGAVIRHSRLGFDQGLYRDGGCRLYVGRGVGAAILPLRWNCPPEVPLVRLVPSA